MKLQELATKPQLIKIEIDDEHVVETYGEVLEFYVWDRQPIEKFIKFAGKNITPEMMPDLVKFCEEMILDEDGNRVLTDGVILPNTVMALCLSKTLESLGK